MVQSGQGAVRVCHVAVADLWAGAEVQLKVLLSKLVHKQEFSLSVILFNGGRLEKAIEGLGIPVRVFPESRSGSGKIFLELVREFKKSNIQIIHTHKYKDTILAAPAARLAGFHMSCERCTGSVNLLKACRLST